MKQKEYLAIMLLLIVTFIWGVTFIVVKDVITIIPPFTFNFIRFLVASLWLALILGYMNTKKQSELKTRSKKELLIYGVLLGIFLFLGFLLQTYGLKYTTSSKAGFITGLNVVLTPLILILFTKYRPSIIQIAGILISIVGLFLLTIKGQQIMNKGDFLVLLCAIAFSIHIILTSKYANKFSILQLTLVQLITVSTLSFLCALFTEPITILISKELLLSTNFLFALFITSLLATTFAYIVQTYAQSILSPTRVAMTFIMEPVFAALAGVLFANEIISSLSYIGCLFILLGMIFVELPQRRKKNPFETNFNSSIRIDEM